MLYAHRWKVDRQSTTIFHFQWPKMGTIAPTWALHGHQLAASQAKLGPCWAYDGPMWPSWPFPGATLIPPDPFQLPLGVSVQLFGFLKTQHESQHGPPQFLQGPYKGLMLRPSWDPDSPLERLWSVLTVKCFCLEFQMVQNCQHTAILGPSWPRKGLED